MKEYNFACEIVKVDLSVGPLEFGDNQTGKRNRLGNFHIGLLIVKLTNLRSLQSLFGILQLKRMFGVLLYKCIYV